MSLWDEYQDFSTNAKPHGGANAYLEFLENIAQKEGRDEGRIQGGAFVGIAMLVVGGLLYGSYWGYCKLKKYLNDRKQEKQLAPTIRQEFLDNVEKFNIDAANIELTGVETTDGEPVDNEPPKND